MKHRPLGDLVVDSGGHTKGARRRVHGQRPLHVAARHVVRHWMGGGYIIVTMQIKNVYLINNTYAKQPPKIVELCTFFHFIVNCPSASLLFCLCPYIDDCSFVFSFLFYSNPRIEVL